MLDKIISGGQTGAEEAGWRVAKAFGVATGGWMSSGFPTGAGFDPEVAKDYGTAELPTDGELVLIERNVRDSDATIWFGGTTTSAAQATVGACQRLGKPCMPVYPEASFEPWHVASWIEDHRIGTLNVAGNLEGDEPGIGDRVERFLSQTLRLLGHQPG